MPVYIDDVYELWHDNTLVEDEDGAHGFLIANTNDGANREELQKSMHNALTEYEAFCIGHSYAMIVITTNGGELSPVYGFYGDTGYSEAIYRAKRLIDSNYVE